MLVNLARRRPARPVQPSSAAESSIRSTGAPLGMLVLLGVQFLLGMAVNPYTQLAAAGGGTAMMRSGPLVVIHMMLGMLLAAAAPLAVALALPYGPRAVACAAVGLLVAGLGACSSGWPAGHWRPPCKAPAPSSLHVATLGSDVYSQKQRR